MSTTDPKPRKHKQKEYTSQPVNGADRLKAVVRRLPPNLPEEIFWQSVQAWVTDETVVWRSYHPGKLRTKRVNKEGIPSRAYIAFKNEVQVATFSRAYDGHVFRDKAGNESYAVVEYAPFQKVPTEKKKTDARNNTIDKDEDYLSFLETLKGGTKTESVSLEALIAASQPPPPPTTTPLLEALKAEKSAQKDKEAIIRNHAHYKDVSGASKKEEAKKKVAAATAVQAVKTESPAPISKRAKKAAAAQLKTQESAPGKGGPLPPPPVGGASTKTPASARHRPPKEPRGQPHAGKGDASSTPAPQPVSASGPSPGQAVPSTTTDAVPSSSPAQPQAQAQGPRKNRPVIGLGRQFEAALSGAGVAVSQSPGDRKRRDKVGEGGGGAGPGTEGSAPATGKGKHKHREERQHPPQAEAVPSILQRPAEVASLGPDVVIMQRPQLMEHGEGAGGAGPVAGATPTPTPGPGGRGGPRRGRGRGRGGHRGG